MTLSTSIVEITHAVQDEIDAANLFAASYYGGLPELVPSYPAVGVLSGRKRREIIATRQYELLFQVEVEIAHGLVQDQAANREEADALAERVESLLTMTNLGGKVVNGSGFVTQFQPAIRQRPNGPMIQITRMLWEAKSRQTF